jgi:shikimate kinase
MERGVVIYLFASLDQLFERTRRDRNRPLLQTENPKQKLEQLLAERDPIYREVADMVVHTEDRSVKSVIKEIRARLEREAEFRKT